MVDDFIEADGGEHNIRVMNNRGFNAAHHGLSTQPMFGGPVYFIGNLVYHVPFGGAIKVPIQPVCWFITIPLFLCILGWSIKESNPTPNILIAIADDVSYPHMGKACNWINTPAFDRVASSGLLFENAYTPNAKCAPSRACLLTGRNPWQLEQAANMWAYFPAKYKTYPEALIEKGYFVGFTGKPWAPGVLGEKGGTLRKLCGEMWSAIKLKPPTKSISTVDYASNFIEQIETSV